MGWGGIHRFGTARPFSSCIAHQFYLVESRRSYISCAGCCISSFSTFKSIEVPFYLPILSIDDSTYPAISENSIVLWNARFLPSSIGRAIVCIPATCLSACRFSFHWPLRPPRRLSPRFPRRFSRRLPIVLPACRSHQLHTARVDFSERPSCRSSDVVPVSSVPARRSCMPMHIAFGRHIA